MTDAITERLEWCQVCQNAPGEREIEDLWVCGDDLCETKGRELLDTLWADQQEQVSRQTA